MLSIISISSGLREGSFIVLRGESVSVGLVSIALLLLSPDQNKKQRLVTEPLADNTN